MPILGTPDSVSDSGSGLASDLVSAVGDIDVTPDIVVASVASGISDTDVASAVTTLPLSEFD